MSPTYRKNGLKSRVLKGCVELYKVLFICHGNICRSTAAQYVMQDMVKRAGLAESFFIDSAATSTEEIGNPVYPPMRRTLESHGVPCEGHRARQMTRRDYDAFDLIIAADDENLYYMNRICGGDPERKFHLLMDYTDRPGTEISDPWYTRNFERAYEDVVKGCTGLLGHLRESGMIYE